MVHNERLVGYVITHRDNKGRIDTGATASAPLLGKETVASVTEGDRLKAILESHECPLPKYMVVTYKLCIKKYFVSRERKERARLATYGTIVPIVK